jgi:hypothetical protein
VTGIVPRRGVRLADLTHRDAARSRQYCIEGGVERLGLRPRPAVRERPSVICRRELYRVDEVHDPKCGIHVARTNQNNEDRFFRRHLPSRQCSPLREC